MDDFFMRFLIALLAAWRVTHLLTKEDGPADLIVRLRVRLGHGLWGRMMDCFNCMSLWVAAPVALFLSHRLLPWTLSWLALSGGACLLERLGAKPVLIERGMEPDPQSSEGDNNVLR